MPRKRGMVFIAPDAHYIPPGRLVDPEVTTFWVTWDDHDEPHPRGAIEETEIVGADAAIAWARERSDHIAIRLAHSDESYFSAGTVQVDGEDLDGAPIPYPSWPPSAPPADGWWTPAHDAAAQAA